MTTTFQNRQQGWFQPTEQVPVHRRQRPGRGIHDQLASVGSQGHPTGFEAPKQFEGVHTSNTSRSLPDSEVGERSSPSPPSSPRPLFAACLAWSRSPPSGQGSSPLPRFSGVGDDEFPDSSTSIMMRRPL